MLIRVVYHLWLLPGMFEKAGRIRIFSQLNEPILKLLVDSDIALTLEEAQRVMKRIQATRKKKPLASASKIKHVVAHAFSGKRSCVSEFAVVKGIDSLVSSKTLARILYQRFRCEAIHGGRVSIDESRFFLKLSRTGKRCTLNFTVRFNLSSFQRNF